MPSATRLYLRGPKRIRWKRKCSWRLGRVGTPTSAGLRDGSMPRGKAGRRRWSARERYVPLGYVLSVGVQIGPKRGGPTRYPKREALGD